jgi:formate dehydrogenase subunit gamma
MHDPLTPRAPATPPAEATAAGAAIDAVIAEFAAASTPDATQLLPLLQHVMARTGSITPAAERAVAAALDVSRADVHGVVTFYDDFAPGAHAGVDICAAEACQARGARALLAHVAGRGGWRAVYCLGNCACGPSARTGDRIHANVTPARLDALLAAGEAPAGEARR